MHVLLWLFEAILAIALIAGFFHVWYLVAKIRSDVAQLMDYARQTSSSTSHQAMLLADQLAEMKLTNENLSEGFTRMLRGEDPSAAGGE